eukprot:g82358.t1
MQIKLPKFSISLSKSPFPTSSHSSSPISTRRPVKQPPPPKSSESTLRSVRAGGGTPSPNVAEQTSTATATAAAPAINMTITEGRVCLTSVMCDECRLAFASLYCHKCEQPLCRGCDARLHKAGLMVTHERTSIVDALAHGLKCEPADVYEMDSSMTSRASASFSDAFVI